MLVTARKFKERGAIAGEEVEMLEPIDKTALPMNLDEGGLFPDLVAADVEENGEEELPLLKSQGATAGEN